MSTPILLSAAFAGLSVRWLPGHGWVAHRVGSFAIMCLGRDPDLAERRLSLIVAELAGAVA